MVSTRRARAGFLAASIVAVLALGAFGGSSIRSSSAGTATGKVKPASLKFALDFTGSRGGKADPKKTPVVIGFANQEGGTLGFPEADAAAEATVKFVNTQLGGINGHPLKLKKCLIAGTDDVQKCGTEMANDSSVTSVVVPLLALNNQAFYTPIDSKKPVFLGIQIFPVDYTTANVYSYFPALTSTSPTFAKFASTVLHAKRVALVRTDNSAGQQASEFAQSALKAAGITPVDVPVPEPGTAPQYASAIQAANLKPGDVLEPQVTSIGCASIYDALQSLQLKVTVVAGELCGLPPIPGHLKDLGVKHTAFPEGWYMGTNGYTSYMPVKNSHGADVYVDMMKAYAPKAKQIHGYAPVTWATMLEVVKFMDASGATVTPDSISAQAKAFTGPGLLTAGEIKCGAGGLPSSCAFASGWERYKGGKFVSIADGLNGKFLSSLPNQ